jgi:alkyl hydroperoxide reductase subunit AhpF
MAGDVTGMLDIKAAINDGAEIARHLLEQQILRKPPRDAHVIIIGGGPAGVSAALKFEKRGVSAGMGIQATRCLRSVGRETDIQSGV